MGKSRWVLHLDLDQFIAAVEIRRRPELRGLPVVVGGDGDPTRRRQVVATASYEARAFGVRSGMPLSTALRRCPQAVFLPSDRAAYDDASAEVWDVVRQQPVLVEVWGWDEGFLGTDVDDPMTLAVELREIVAETTGFTCCIGVGDNKVRAKLATGFAKAPPGTMPADAPGVFRLTAETWWDVMGSRPTDSLCGSPRWASAPSATSHTLTSTSSGPRSGRPPGRGCSPWAAARAAGPSPPSPTFPAGTAGRSR
jgi:DNA polymerase-4